jgi:ubiquinone/menaquinone biosynthesis C-methylase UbiE
MAKDLFSTQASGYAQYRPTYPPELFDHILSFVQHRRAAWDCATGNGQAAVALAAFFDTVYATDISEKQLQQAIAHPHIVYSRSTAEETAFKENSFDLITVAQAYHWFHFDAFHQEVTRIARAGAVVAIWGYSLVTSAEVHINERILSFYVNVTGPYWDKERRYVDERYTTVPFPYEELPAKTFNIAVQYDLAALAGYLNTWSAVQQFIKANGYNPVHAFIAELETLWPADEVKALHFPLFLRIGRVGK